MIHDLTTQKGRNAYNKSLQEQAESILKFHKSKKNMENDKTLFVAFYFWGGYNKQSVWQEFDKIYELADKFVQSYSQDKTWEDESFEEYMDNFIREHIPQ
jgi:hypothetical protein